MKVCNIPWGKHYRTIHRFSAIADDRQGVRAALEQDFQVRPDNAGNRARIAAVVSAWDTAKHYHEEDIKIRQEAKGMGTPRPLPHRLFSYATCRGAGYRGTEIGEKEQPSTEYIAMILEEIEQDEIAAHSLDEVTSKKDSQSLQLQSTLDQSGRVRIAAAERHTANKYRGVEAEASHRSQCLADGCMEDDKQGFLTEPGAKAFRSIYRLSPGRKMLQRADRRAFGGANHSGLRDEKESSEDSTERQQASP